LEREPERILDGQCASFEAFSERLPFDELHRDEARAVVLIEPLDRGKIRVIERRERLRLALKPDQAIRVFRKVARQSLDRDLATELGVARAPDFAHPAFAERARNLVVAERLTDHYVSRRLDPKPGKSYNIRP
jgi:hypothetical protein